MFAVDAIIRSTSLRRLGYISSMAVRETPAARIDRLLAAGDPLGARDAAETLLKQAPNSFLGRFGRCRANVRLGNFIEAERDLDAALALSPKDEHALMMRATLDSRLGLVDRAIEVYRTIAAGKGPHAVEAAIDLLQALHRAGRKDEYLEIVKAGGAWTADLRAQLVFARATAFVDRTKGIEELQVVARANVPWPLKRWAAFEAVGLLDKSGRYREAFDFAVESHRATTGPVSLDEWLVPLDQQLEFLSRPNWFKSRGEPVEGCAFVCAMPRSGTTLLETMLDRHPAIGGIGEFDGLDIVCRDLFSRMNWQRTPSAVPAEQVARLRHIYTEGAQHIRKLGATWTFDKSLRTWRALPEIHMVLPGSFCIAVDRDPRDVATSIFLTYFNPKTYEWTQDFSAIRRVIEYQRKVTPRALEVLEIKHEAFLYEDFVEDPSAHAERCLQAMGLPMDPRVLSPEGSSRTAATPSYTQVRQPINRSSIGRWKNYAWAFDGAWDEVVAQHEARRTHRTGTDHA